MSTKKNRFCGWKRIYCAGVFFNCIDLYFLVFDDDLSWNIGYQKYDVNVASLGPCSSSKGDSDQIVQVKLVNSQNSPEVITAHTRCGFGEVGKSLTLLMNSIQKK